MIIHNVCCHRCSNKKSHKVFSENVILELTTMQFYHIDGLRTVLKRANSGHDALFDSNCTEMPINCLYHKTILFKENAFLRYKKSEMYYKIYLYVL